ncbi:Elongation factor G C-terminus [Fragilaria crotonensis]|nr:Elongation factor G C-terminus [Fragilaria crotonensis]
MTTPSSRTSIFTEPSLTRLVTIIAQVDHGKTTLADSLIESNGIISERLAGTLRYLDDLQEEQRRGITMRTSAIGLSHLYQPTNKQKHQQQHQRKQHRNDKNNSHDNQQAQENKPQKFVLHLLDSPGHADFSSEVSSALQCCDAALLVVDAVEGLCARTHQVLREAFVHQLVPILVIIKVDRLCTELCLTEAEAYLRLRKLLESMNAASAAMLNSSRAEANDNNDGDDQEKDNNRNESIWTFTEANVVFGSALYGWGFTVPSLARHLFRTKQLEIKPLVLRQYLFGDFKFKNGKVLKWKPEQSDDLPMFSEFALRPLWQIYQGVSQASMTAGLGSNLFGNATTTVGATDLAVKITATTSGMEQVQQLLSMGSSNQSLAEILHQTGSATEDTILRAVLRRYRPLSEAVLNAVCETGPSPKMPRDRSEHEH